MSHMSKQEKRDFLEQELHFAWKNYVFLSRLDRKCDVLPHPLGWASSCERFTSETENVLCGIDITVVFCTAAVANPFPYSETCNPPRRTVCDLQTIRAGLGGKFLVYFD